MSAALPKNPTTSQASQAWTKGFAAAVRNAAGKGDPLTPEKAARMTGPYADNAQNYFSATGRVSATADEVIASGARYVRQQTEAVAGKGKRLSAADIRHLPKDLVDDFSILEGKPAATQPEAKTIALDAAVNAEGVDALAEKGKSFKLLTYDSSKSREDVLRDIVQKDPYEMNDREVSKWFHSTVGSHAVNTFASDMLQIAAEQKKSADSKAEGTMLAKLIKGVGQSAAETFLPASKFKSVELAKHAIYEDGDSRFSVLFAKKDNGSWMVLCYQDFPF